MNSKVILTTKQQESVDLILYCIKKNIYLNLNFPGACGKTIILKEVNRRLKLTE